MSYSPGETLWYEQFDEQAKADNARMPFLHRHGAPTLAQLAFLLCKLPPPPCHVLDAGCGFGIVAHAISLAGYDVTAADVCTGVIEWCKKQEVSWRGSKPGTVRFELRDYDALPWDSYDAIVFTNALHHSRNLTATLRSCFQALHSGGVIVICEPGITHASSPQSKKHAMHHDITEKSCPPFKVIWHGWRCGFRNFSVHQNPISLIQAAYVTNPFAEHIAGRIMSRVPFNLALFSMVKWLHGAVVMYKPSIRQ
jgi:2-polyprenyl-3-methyl-5-hydroxy-6-metoxy-1,4-benzoquinol methylase